MGVASGFGFEGFFEGLLKDVPEYGRLEIRQLFKALHDLTSMRTSVPESGCQRRESMNPHQSSRPYQLLHIIGLAKEVDYAINGDFLRIWRNSDDINI
jgi:hypothetical protein